MAWGGPISNYFALISISLRKKPNPLNALHGTIPFEIASFVIYDPSPGNFYKLLKRILCGKSIIRTYPLAALPASEFSFSSVSQRPPPLWS